MSQEYTPVDWVDETTSQQGTLITAARLDQMQTAHHFTDGFEEVDAVPTADPGVDYHKVVYCTADATFYRWDGEVWTADIDEETKHLLDQEIARAEHAEGLIQGYLDAHEANHNNPHQVTKAQVGLGNCDNTADLDKPISTATQAALDTKADKATTLAGYGITDAYTKAQADTLLADKADVADVYDKTATDTLLAGKVDKLVSSPAGTYKSVTVNDQGQVTAGTNPDTLAGYGITDAYTKTEVNTKLTDGSVTKVGTADVGSDTKPIKLVAGVPTAVANDLADVAEVQAALDKKVDISLGVVPWSATVTYPANAFTNYNGTLYRSLQAENVGHVPLSETAWWSEYSPAAGSSGLIGPDNTYTANIGDGSSTVIAVTHNLGTKEVLWAVWSNTDGHVIGASADKTSTSVLTLTFAAAPAAGEYRVLVFRPGDAARIYEQTFTASSTVVITHNLGRLPSGVSVYDPTGRKVGVRMTVDTTTATLSFAGYETGNYKIEVIA